MASLPLGIFLARHVPEPLTGWRHRCSKLSWAINKHGSRGLNDLLWSSEGNSGAGCIKWHNSPRLAKEASHSTAKKRPPEGETWPERHYDGSGIIIPHFISWSQVRISTYLKFSGRTHRQCTQRTWQGYLGGGHGKGKAAHFWQEHQERYCQRRGSTWEEL